MPLLKRKAFGRQLTRIRCVLSNDEHNEEAIRYLLIIEIMNTSSYKVFKCRHFFLKEEMQTNLFLTEVI